jgi:4-amino-4-deoxy-L-arabinose transferase-like glycosyltransferase
MPQRWLTRAAMFLPAAAVVGILGTFADVDPWDGFTFSNSPFTDEAWWLANARNFAVFGHWSTDDWNLHLVSPVYSTVQAVALMVAGVDLIAARLVVVAAVALTCIALAVCLRRPFGNGPAIVAAAAYGFSLLILYYGRLAYVEPVVALALVTGAPHSALSFVHAISVK